MALVNHKGAEVDLAEVEVLVLDMVDKVDMVKALEEVDMEEVDMALAEVEGGLAQ